MKPTTFTQLMGEQPVAARRRGPVAVECTRPDAGVPTVVPNAIPNMNGRWALAAGFWVTSVVTTHAIKRPARHLASRPT